MTFKTPRKNGSSLRRTAAVGGCIMEEISKTWGSVRGDRFRHISKITSISNTFRRCAFPYRSKSKQFSAVKGTSSKKYRRLRVRHVATVFRYILKIYIDIERGLSMCFSISIEAETYLDSQHCCLYSYILGVGSLT